MRVEGADVVSAMGSRERDGIHGKAHSFNELNISDIDQSGCEPTRTNI